MTTDNTATAPPVDTPPPAVVVEGQPTPTLVAADLATLTRTWAILDVADGYICDHPNDNNVGCGQPAALSRVRRRFAMPNYFCENHIPTEASPILAHIEEVMALRPTPVHNSLLGSTHQLLRGDIPKLNRLFTRFNLGFEIIFDPSEQRHVARSLTTVLNINVIAEKYDARRKLKTTRATLAKLIEQTGTGTRIARLHPDSLSNFLESVRQWPMIMEIAGRGQSLDRISPRIELRPTDDVGVRFHATQYFWPAHGGQPETFVLIPPMPFIMGKDIKAGLAAHPHVHNELNLCNGNARWEYGNPFQMLPLMVEYMSGVREDTDQASHNWITNGKRWWKDNFKALSAVYPEGVPLYVAPNSKRKTSDMVVLTQDVVDQYLASPGESWVRAVAPDTKAATVQALQKENIHASKFTIRGDAAECADCKGPAWLTAHFPSLKREIPICGCCASGLTAWHNHRGVDKHPSPSADNIVHVYFDGDTPRPAAQVCTLPICGDPTCEEHYVVESKHPAVYTAVVPGFRTGFACMPHVGWVNGYLSDTMGANVHVGTAPMGQDPRTLVDENLRGEGATRTARVMQAGDDRWPARLPNTFWNAVYAAFGRTHDYTVFLRKFPTSLQLNDTTAIACVDCQHHVGEHTNNYTECPPNPNVVVAAAARRR